MPEAVGRSEWVIAVNLDIRGFTSYSLSRDSAETAIYLKKVYMRIIDGFFKDASFFKPTGDGLLVVVQFEEPTFKKETRAAIDDALRLVDSFGSLVDDEKMIRFDRPEVIGVGIAAGTASRLVSRRTTLDYSGRPLNLASRLMDIARPSGVVFHASLDYEGLPKAVLDRFNRDEEIYVKGIAEVEPMTVFYTSELTKIPDTYRKPIRPARRETFTSALSLAEMKRRDLFLHRLSHEPLNREEISVKIHYPDYKDGRRETAFMRVWTLGAKEFTYFLDGDVPTVKIDYRKVVPKFEGLGMPTRARSQLEISYPAADATSGHAT